MSTREIAYGIINNMTDEQVDGFVAMLGMFVKSQADSSDDGQTKEPKKDPQKAHEALEWLDKEIHPCPNIGDDYKQEYLDYLDERYGV